MAPAPSRHVLGQGLLDSVVYMHRYFTQVKGAIDNVPLESRMRACDEYGLGYVKFNKIHRLLDGAMRIIHHHGRTEKRRLANAQCRMNAKTYTPSDVRGCVHEAVDRAVENEAEIRAILADIHGILDTMESNAMRDYAAAREAADADVAARIAAADEPLPTPTAAAEATADDGTAGTWKPLVGAAAGAVAGAVAGVAIATKMAAGATAAAAASGGSAAGSCGAAALLCNPVAMGCLGAVAVGLLGYFVVKRLCAAPAPAPSPVPAPAPRAPSAAELKRERDAEAAAEALKARRDLTAALQQKVRALDKHYDSFVTIFKHLAKGCGVAIGVKPRAGIESKLSDSDEKVRANMNDELDAAITDLDVLVDATAPAA